MQTKSIVVATPNPTERMRLARIVDRLPGFSVIACTSDLMHTYNEVEERLPKAVLIADVLASLPEFEVMRGLFSTLDIRWLVVTTPDRPSARYELARRGSDLFAVPADAGEEIIGRQLLSLTRTALSRTPPATKPLCPSARTDLTRPGPAPAPLRRTEVQTRTMPGVAPVQIGVARPEGSGRRNRIILIGSSTGGVDALLKVLAAFPPDCPPTVIVQHTGAGFGSSLAGLLDRQCQARVRLAEGSVVLEQGLVLIGAGLKSHLVFESTRELRVGLSGDTQVSGHLPSVDMLFRSAVDLAPRVSAALLTGMGRDGADGLKALRDAGAWTLAQDEASSVVYGMPRAAAELGAAKDILPLDRIGQSLIEGRTDRPENRRELQR